MVRTYYGEAGLVAAFEHSRSASVSTVDVGALRLLSQARGKTKQGRSSIKRFKQLTSVYWKHKGIVGRLQHRQHICL
jgi:catabolite regulation protein CreA